MNNRQKLHKEIAEHLTRQWYTAEWFGPFFIIEKHKRKTRLKNLIKKVWKR